METLLKSLRRLFPPSLHGAVLLVGGTVRDHLLGLDRGDVDLLVTASPEDLIPLGFREVTPKSATRIFFLCREPLGKVEAVIPAPGESLEGELARRDFTANAMAMTLDGELVDPLQGREALGGRSLVPCRGDCFVADPARLFRAFRFEAQGWRLAAEGEALIRCGDWRPGLARMPVERFSSEMLKALAGADPGRFFHNMIRFHAGEEFLPELFRMPEIPAGPLTYHPEGDLLTHSLQVLERLSRRTPDVIPRFCALFHDLGKLVTEPALFPHHHGHDRAGYAAAAAFCTRLRLPELFRRALMGSCRLHLAAARWEELRDGTKLKVAAAALKAGIASFLPLLVAADRGREGLMAGWDTAQEVAGLATRDLGIDPRLLADRDGSRPEAEAGVTPLPVAARGPFIHARRVEEYRRRMAG